MPKENHVKAEKKSFLTSKGEILTLNSSMLTVAGRKTGFGEKRIL